MDSVFVVKREVQEALAAGRPVVALESTVIAHGLPYPQNAQTAIEMEAAILREGVIPATIAILDGRVHIGLDAAAVERLATGKDIVKVSRRDIAVCLARKLDGATTVSATMLLARQAGIRVFATGGIGGVHRGNPTDVSADLNELARTAVAVVCAGAKAILDLPATLEWLETAGVPVLGYRTSEFPAFFARSSALPVDARVESVDQAAAIIHAHWQMGLESGVVLAVPVPDEAALPPAAMESAIEQALAEAGDLRGKAVTPFLLRRVAELTGGESMAANLALLRNNAAVAAQLAQALQVYTRCSMRPADAAAWRPKRSADCAD